MSETTCPVFYPNEQDFADFRGYLEQLEVLQPNMSICKIVPPKSWNITQHDIDTLDLFVKSPIRQITSGKRGVYDLEIYDEHDMSLQEFRTIAKALESTKKLSEDPADIERQYWRSIAMNTTFQSCPLYGADLPGSLFQTSKVNESFPQWNLNFLENTLRLMKETIPGVNTPMLYIGSWKSSFAYHVEDMDLYSINYVHVGAAKVWYGISPSERQRFEVMAQGYFPNDHRRCNQFLRHKTKLFSPMVLKDSNIKFVTAIQHPGEFMITFPGSYHAGFNHGFNIAEATNFALHRWFAIGKEAIPCKCTSFCVKIDVDELETIYLREKIKCRKQGTSLRKILQHPEILKYEYFQHTLEEELEYFPEGDFRIRCFCSWEDIDSCSNTGGAGIAGHSNSSNSSSSSSNSHGKKGKHGTSSSSSSSSSSSGNNSNSNSSNGYLNGGEKGSELTLLRCETCELWFHSECYVENQVSARCLEQSMCYQCSVIEDKEESMRLEVLSTCQGTPSVDFIQSKLMKKPRSAHSNNTNTNTSNTSSSVVVAKNAKDISVKSILAAYQADPMEEEEEDVVDLTEDLPSGPHRASSSHGGGKAGGKLIISRGSGRRVTSHKAADSSTASTGSRFASFSSSMDDYFVSEEDFEEDIASEARTSMDISTSPDQSPPHHSATYSPLVKPAVAKRGKKRRKIREDDWVRLNWGGQIDVVGMIVSIDDQGQGRLHIKGTKKGEDTWVPLDKCHIVEPPPDSDDDRDTAADKTTVDHQLPSLPPKKVPKSTSTVASETSNPSTKVEGSISNSTAGSPSSLSGVPKLLQHRLIPTATSTTSCSSSNSKKEASSNSKQQPNASNHSNGASNIVKPKPKPSPEESKEVPKPTNSHHISTTASHGGMTILKGAAWKPSLVPSSHSTTSSTSSSTSSLTLMRTRKEQKATAYYSLLSTDDERSDAESTSESWTALKTIETAPAGKEPVPVIAPSVGHSLSTGNTAVEVALQPSASNANTSSSVPIRVLHSSALPTITKHNNGINWASLPTHIKPSTTVVDLLSWDGDEDDEDTEEDVEIRTSHPKIVSSLPSSDVFRRSAPLRACEIIDLSL